MKRNSIFPSVKVDNYISTIQLHFNSQDKKHFLGYDDYLHWQPHKLRWSELEAICQAVSITDGKYRILGCRYSSWLALRQYALATMLIT
jgi:hypothetical protein